MSPTHRLFLFPTASGFFHYLSRFSLPPLKRRTTPSFFLLPHSTSPRCVVWDMIMLPAHLPLRTFTLTRAPGRSIESFKNNPIIPLSSTRVNKHSSFKLRCIRKDSYHKASQVLLRLVEPSGGSIIIDGINISTLGLHDLRSRFWIIPQEPILFEGTLKSNIAPISQHSDEEIWRSLERCQFSYVIASKSGKLDSAGDVHGRSNDFSGFTNSFSATFVACFIKLLSNGRSDESMEANSTFDASHIKSKNVRTFDACQRI
ncbi:unnamed protein product [Lactuca saligna]|uniref:Uncharacterized protein n=1 Tax=Lactuca saligna TaxID=75948 RepID=A0AA35YZP7_LACSI|nr:unnamed protein product [Lactuca saligna]